MTRDTLAGCGVWSVFTRSFSVLLSETFDKLLGPPGLETRARKLLPDVIDEIASREPDAIYAEFPASPTTYDAGFKPITFAQLSRSIDCVATWLENSLGRGQDFEALAYIGPNDARYVFAFVGAIKAGYKLLLTSPRNSIEAQLSLFEQLGCRRVIATDPPLPVIAQILQERPLEVLTIASQDELMRWRGPRYRYKRTWREGRSDEVFASHTSGSTGLPQARTYTNEFISRVARTTLISPPPGHRSLQRMLGGNKSVVLLPLFHPAGVQFGILNAIYNRTTVVLPLPSAPPTVETLLKVITNVKSDWAIAAPFTLEPLAKNEKLLSEVKAHLDFLVYGGGALPRPLGDVIARQIRLTNYLGSSETAGYPLVFPPEFDHVREWHYVQVHPAAGVEFEPRNEGCFELVLRRSASSEPYQPVFEVLPELSSYATKDLFVPHPTRTGMWTHASRSDDLIVFLNGLKFNPVQFENEIGRHPDVKAALMFGSQRFEAGLLIEPADHVETTRAAFVTNIWPAIEVANRSCPSYARVSQAHVLIADPKRPFLRTGKQSLQRQATLDAYQERIEQLYINVDHLIGIEPAEVVREIDLTNREQVSETVRDIAIKVGGIESIQPDDDFFHKGIDSIHVLHMTRMLRMTLGLGIIKTSTIYLNPSPSALAKAIVRLSDGNEEPQGPSEAGQRDMMQVLEELQGFVDQESAKISDFKDLTMELPTEDVQKHVVVLTGSTGFIGSYLLRALMNSPEVSMVYCLNRSPDSGHKQYLRNIEIDPELPTQFMHDRVKFVEMDLSKNDLGLDAALLSTILSDTSIIIHNAWSVDFNFSLRSFTSHLRGVVQLSAIAARCRRRVTMLFSSSIGAVMHLAETHESVPESVIEDFDASPIAGYSESKFVAEQVLSYLSPRFGLNVRIARIGQVCGACRTPGKWKLNDWIPSLVRTSQHLGIIPETLGEYPRDVLDLNWIPVDVLADSLLEIGFRPPPAVARGENTAEVYHMVNPNLTSWHGLLPHIIETLDDLASNTALAAHDHATITNGSSKQSETEAALLASTGNNNSDKSTEPLKDDATNGHTTNGHATKDQSPNSNTQRHESADSCVRVVSAAEWLERLRTSAAEVQAGGDAVAALEANPALKLLEFYKITLAMSRPGYWETTRTEAVSPSLHDARPVDSMQMRAWVRTWCGREPGAQHG